MRKVLFVLLIFVCVSLSSIVFAQEAVTFGGDNFDGSATIPFFISVFEQPWSMPFPAGLAFEASVESYSYSPTILTFSRSAAYYDGVLCFPGTGEDVYLWSDDLGAYMLQTPDITSIIVVYGETWVVMDGVATFDADGCFTGFAPYPYMEWLGTTEVSSLMREDTIKEYIE